MKVTFPHMGNVKIPIKCLLQGLRLEVVIPPPITRRTLELGVKHSPEFACMPLKINVGNFIEAMEQGADTIIMAGGWGPCRFGYYAQVQRDILRDLGYNFRMVILEAPEFRLSQLLEQVKTLGENVTFWEAWKAARFAWHKLNAVDRLEKGLEYYLPRVQDKSSAERIYNQGLTLIEQADYKAEVDYHTRYTLEQLKGMKKHKGLILKIGLVGEIYTILEPSTNYDMIRELGRLNVEVKRSVYTSEWVNDHLLGGVVKKSQRRHIINCAQPYLNYWVGGHGLETVGYTVDFARQGFDGVIQVGPLTCMPEIVAQSVLSRVSPSEEIPCMTLYFDEHSGSAGVRTRLEAFVDMLYRSKRNRKQRAGPFASLRD
ncbi:CoA protein activase [Syntrophomonas erecta]